MADREMVRIARMTRRQDESFGREQPFKGNFGSTVDLAPGNAGFNTGLIYPVPPGEFRTVLDVQTEDPRGEELTVTLHAPGNFGAKGFFAVGLVDWGNGGAASQAVVDYLNGVSFTLNASHIRVAATCPASAGILRVGAHVARGSGGSSVHHPQRTIADVSNIAPAGTVTFPIPPFAKRFRVVRRPALSIDVEAIAPTGFVDSIFNLGAGNQMDWESIQMADTSIRITNQDPAVQLATVSICYELSL